MAFLILVFYFYLIFMTKRTLCPNCIRPQNACICSFITPIDNDIHVVVLQHPSEISQTKGTVTLLAKSLLSCQVIIGENFTDNEPFLHVLTKFQGLLLYPSEQAQELSGSVSRLLQQKELQSHSDGNNEGNYKASHESSHKTSHETKQINITLKQQIKPYCLIILDGTWKKSYKMFMLSQTLQQLPHVCLPESLANTGQYYIRKVAKKNALSSLEACCYALGLLEGNDKYQKLLMKFNDFNQFQLSFRPKSHLSADQINYLGKK